MGSRFAARHREQPATCYWCGGDVPSDAVNQAHCGQRACWERQAQQEARAPFTFVRDGETFVCAWHEGHNPRHPANRGVSHGCCDDCLPKLGSQR